MSNLSPINALILARSGSKGVPDKNIKCINGIAISHYPILACLKAREINRIIYASDSDTYLELAENFVKKEAAVVANRMSFFKRSLVNSIDNVSSWKSASEVIRGLNLDLGDLTLLIGGSSLTITNSDISKFCKTFKGSNKSGMSVKLLSYPIENTFLLNGNMYKRHSMSDPISQRQKAKRIYQPDGHIYIRRNRDILDDIEFPNDQTQCIDLEKDIYLNIDTEADLAFSRWSLNEKNSN